MTQHHLLALLIFAMVSQTALAADAPVTRDYTTAEQHSSDIAACKDHFNRGKAKPQSDLEYRLEIWIKSHPDDGESLYFLGRLTPGEKGEELKQRAVNSGHASARAWVGYCRLTVADAAPAFRQAGKELLEGALEEGNPDACLLAGALLAAGDVAEFPRDLGRARSLLEKAVNADMVNANFALAGVLLQEGHEKEAVTAATKGADLGDSLAQESLGRWYRDGLHVTRDPVAAFSWLSKAAARKHPSVDNLKDLAQCYELGIGVKQDLSKAVELYDAAAQKRDQLAGMKVAAAYLRGQGVKMDVAKGVALLEGLAEAGCAGAQYMLGEGYVHGLWYERDLSKARVLFQQAADKDCAEAKFYLQWLDASARK